MHVHTKTPSRQIFDRHMPPRTFFAMISHVHQINRLAPSCFAFSNDHVLTHRDLCTLHPGVLEGFPGGLRGSPLKNRRDPRFLANNTTFSLLSPENMHRGSGGLGVFGSSNFHGVVGCTRLSTSPSCLTHVYFKKKKSHILIYRKTPDPQTPGRDINNTVGKTTYC